MIQLPTGGGKTRIAAALLAEWLRRGDKAIWLTHRRELSDQTCRVLKEAGVPANSRPKWGIESPAPSLKAGVTILMAQRVSRRNKFRNIWDSYGPEDLLVIDEAHHAIAPGWARAICQWPGMVIGLTATPWRFEKHIGFNHLFDRMIAGPQISDMQSGDWLAKAQVLTPVPDEVICGGKIPSSRDFSEAEVYGANQQRPEVMTALAVKFWRGCAEYRPTIIYAVSVRHAENLSAVFKQQDIPAAVILGNSPSEQRASAIKQFSEGKLRVLINVAVATEGFDMPDAACIVLARPTASLALYLQMVGRGLRPKSDGGNCLILDLAGNVERHGLPDCDRQWSLDPRGSPDDDTSNPVVRCPDCSSVSPSASHRCRFCGNSFGKSCQRCGKWRTWKYWRAEEYCGMTHELVCDCCHADAHLIAKLPVNQVLRSMLDIELTESVQRLAEVQNQVRYVALELGQAYGRGAFNDLSDQMRNLLRRESEAKKDLCIKMEEKIGSRMLKYLLGYLQISIEELALDDLQLYQGRFRLQHKSTGEIIEWDSSP